MRTPRVVGIVLAVVVLATGCTGTDSEDADATWEPEWTAASATPTPTPAPTPDPTEEPVDYSEPVRDYSGLEEAVQQDEAWSDFADISVVTGWAPEKFTEYQVLLDLHGMSHQKVVAEDTGRYGAIDPKGLNELYRAIDAHPDWSNNEVYLPIMDRWAVGDFSQPVEDYNTLAELLGDHIAPAKRVKTAEEESAYLSQWLP